MDMCISSLYSACIYIYIYTHIVACWLFPLVVCPCLSCLIHFICLIKLHFCVRVAVPGLNGISVRCVHLTDPPPRPQAVLVSHLHVSV